MTDLERRALLGDRQAQEECTRKGIVLPCPKCFKSVKVYGPEDWEPTFYDPDSGGDPYEFDCECGFAFSTYKYDFKDALADWNTRQAPPIGRCASCTHWDDRTCECESASDIEVAYHKYTEPDFFCGDYEPKYGEEDAEI